jgi:hypothetical protein
VLLADASELPAIVERREIRARGWVVQAPRHHVPPAGVVLSGDLALVCHRLPAEGQGSGVDERFGCAIGAAAGVDYEFCQYLLRVATG